MKFKAFIKKWVINNIGYKILALVFAFVLWLVILNITDPETTRTISNIPVSIENEDAILDGTQVYEITSGETASVTVTGSRSIISSLSAEDFLATADFSALSITNAVPIEVELTGEMARYSSQVEINVRTKSMMLTLDTISTRTLPVELTFTGTLQDSLVVADSRVTPEYITISAPQTILNTITSITAEVDYTYIDSSTTLTVAPVINGLDGEAVDLGEYGEADYTDVVVSIEIYHTKTISITMQDPATVPAEGYSFTGLEFSINSVTVQGNEDIVSALESVEIPASLLDITGATANVSVTVDVSDYLPEGVTIHSGVSRAVITANIVQDETETTESDEDTDTDEDESETEEETT